MYQPDAVACLARLADVLVPGGLIVLQEHDSTAMPICRPAMPLHERVSAWIWETVAHEGADVHIGVNLAPALVRAGFAIQRVRAEATVLTPHQSHAIGAIARAMLERIVAAGVATAREIDVDTLDARLAAERRVSNGTCLWEMVFGAWARNAGWHPWHRADTRVARIVDVMALRVATRPRAISAWRIDQFFRTPDLPPSARPSLSLPRTEARTNARRDDHEQDTE
jgi:hypothetical protein